MGSNENIRDLSEEIAMPQILKSVCVCAKSHIGQILDRTGLYVGKYWVKLDFINTCKEPQL